MRKQNKSALTISFALGGTPVHEASTTSLATETRGGAISIDRNSDHQKFTTKQSQLALIAWGFATNNPLQLIAPIFTQELLPESVHEPRGFAINTETQKIVINSSQRSFSYSTGVRILTNIDAPPIGTLEVEGEVLTDDSIRSFVTLSLSYSTADEKKKFEGLLQSFLDIYKKLETNKEQPLGISSKLMLDYFKRIKRNLFLPILPAAVLISLAAVIPAAIFFIVPFFSAMMLPTLAIIGIGAAVSLTSLFLSYQVLASIYLLFNHSPQQGRILETQISLPTIPPSRADVPSEEQLKAAAEGAGFTAWRSTKERESAGQVVGNAAPAPVAPPALALTEATTGPASNEFVSPPAAPAAPADVDTAAAPPPLADFASPIRPRHPLASVDAAELPGEAGTLAAAEPAGSPASPTSGSLAALHLSLPGAPASTGDGRAAPSTGRSSRVSELDGFRTPTAADELTAKDIFGEMVNRR